MKKEKKFFEIHRTDKHPWIEKLRFTGQRLWFEYHCTESHNSEHAEWWYRSHQRVTVLGVTDNDGYCPAVGRTVAYRTFKARAENALQILYWVRWDDGFEGAVFEDELSGTRKFFERPNPPKRPEKEAA